jgi:hypothetical protein
MAKPHDLQFAYFECMEPLHIRRERLRIPAETQLHKPFQSEHPGPLLLDGTSRHRRSRGRYCRMVAVHGVRYCSGAFRHSIRTHSTCP